MTILITGLIIFFTVHLLPCFPNLRNHFVDRYGELRFKIAYSVVAASGFITIIIGMIYSEFVHLWTPPVWGKHLAMTLMLPSVLLLVSADAPCNIKRFTRHPMLWGVTLWSFAHLSANGDLASLILFASFGSYSLFDMWSANKRGALKSEQVYPLQKDIKVWMIGIAAYVILIFIHPYFTGKTLVVL